MPSFGLITRTDGVVGIRAPVGLTVPERNRAKRNLWSAAGLRLHLVDLVLDPGDQAADAVLGAVQRGGHDDEDNHREGREDGADDPGDAAEAREAAMAGLAAVGVANSDGAEDHGRDSAGKGDEEAAGTQEDEQDREWAEEEGGERRDVGLGVRVGCEAAGGDTAGGWWLRGPPRVWPRMGLCGWGAGWHQGGGGGSPLHSHDRGSDLDLVAGAELDGAGDALPVHVGAVGGAEVLDDDAAGV